MENEELRRRLQQINWQSDTEDIISAVRRTRKAIIRMQKIRKIYANENL